MTTMTATPNHTPAPRTDDPGTYPALTALMLVFGGFVLPVVGWLAGVVMLWCGRSFTAGEKWLGTLVWPAVVAVPAAALAGAGLLREAQAAGWLIAAGVLLAVVGVVVLALTFVKLLRAGRR
ncbi:hypothetical protein [Pseudonocardia phyllosphaerae]|uniref:hypothetical protein n=1 Tax=Pseudonocardia phyllosphaerae TaxID=3390502 RepID=UPI00397A13F2